MSYNTKAVIIQIILLLISVAVMFMLIIFFQSKGLGNLTQYCVFIPTTVLGVYVLFGKYVYIRGFATVTKPVRIGFGLFFLLMMPMIWLIKWLIQ